VALAAFTQTPPSYRSAAVAVLDSIPGGADKAATAVAEHRALGAPIMLTVAGDRVEAWQVRSKEPPRLIARHAMADLDQLFEDYVDRWSPAAIHRIKAMGRDRAPYQLDFVDLGLIPAIESEIHAKLDRLLDEVMTDLVDPGKKLDAAMLFKLTFRLVAAKILVDREHEFTHAWDLGEPGRILDQIAHYYSFSDVLPHDAPGVARAWDRLRSGISFRNVAADDLAFVYEHTLVTKETRKCFDTHSTPYQMAEHIVSAVDWNALPDDTLRVYEPFCGAGVFLVSALRHLRDRLPNDWLPEQRHEFLTARLSGAEIDAFAREAAALSLILADYPNANGWAISNVDLFKPGSLAAGLESANLVLCKPPFTDFKPDERARYPEMSARSVHKPIAVLEAVMDARPDAMGIVLPKGFILGKRYASVRRRIERLYGFVELVELPDRVFNFSTVGAALLVAQERRHDSVSKRLRLRSSTVADSDRASFLTQGKVTSTRSRDRNMEPESEGDLWVEELSEVWDYLAEYPRLGDFVDVHRGIEWCGDQSQASSDEPLPGYRRGLRTIHGYLEQFRIARIEWLDCRPESLRRKAILLPWHKPKVLVSAAQISRGHWCLVAAGDGDGLVTSQQFFGIWPMQEARWDLDSIAALLNGPLANAYIAVHSPEKRILVSAIKAIPLPRYLDHARVRTLVADYGESLRQSGGGMPDPASKISSTNS
jgi:hypothetical protein